MEHPWFLVWPALVALIAFWDCYRWERMSFKTSILIALGMGAGVIGIGLAMVAL